MRKIIGTIALAFVAVVAFSGFGIFGGKYNMISAEETATLIRESKPVSLVDIQVEKEFDAEHLKGAIPTYAYPVKSDEEKAKLDSAIAKLGKDEPIVIVCPRGGGGAEKAYDYMMSKGIAKERLFILTKGQQGWPRDKITDVLVKP